MMCCSTHAINSFPPRSDNAVIGRYSAEVSKELTLLQSREFINRLTLIDPISPLLLKLCGHSLLTLFRNDLVLYRI